MKTNSTLPIALLIVILPLIVFSACQKQKAAADDNFFWTPIDPVADSLMREYELVSRGIVRQPTKIDTIYEKLDSVAKATGNRQIAARSLVTKAYVYKTRAELSKVVECLDSADALTDSVNYPYDKARIVLDILPYAKNLSNTKKYGKLQDLLRVFLPENDSLHISNVYNHMGALAEAIGDEERAVEMFAYAGDWLPSRYEYPKYITSFNIVLSLYRQGKTEEWYPLVDSLRKSEFRYVGSKINLWTMILSYKRDKNLADLQEAYRASCNEMAPDWGKPWVASMLAEHYLNEGNRDSMLYYAGEMRDVMNPKIGHYDDVMRVNAAVYKAEGKNDSAKMCEKELETVLEKRAAVEDAVKVQNAEQQREIAEIDRKLEKERTRSEQRIWIISVSAVVVTLIVILLAVRLMRRRHDRERIALESTLEKNNRRVVAAEMKVAEKEKALSEIARDIQAIKPDEPEVVSRILSTINVNRSGDADWEKFQLLFGEMHPDFADDLRREYPALTAGDVKLACLIFLGLETKQIARILSINPDSVKKNRQRLRAKLGLTPGQPLDLMLRDFERDRRKGRM